MSLATIIAISSRLRESSDGFDFVYVLDDPKITNNILNLIKYEYSEENFVEIGIRKGSGESSNHYRDFIPVKGIIRWF